MTFRWDLTAFAIPLVTLVGCGEPLAGKWESPGLCSNAYKETLEIDSDLSGSGQLVVGCRSNDGPAIMCPATIQLDERYQRDGSWDLLAEFGYCQAAGADLGRGYKMCEERTAETELYCCDSDGSHCLLYTKVSD